MTIISWNPVATILFRRDGGFLQFVTVPTTPCCLPDIGAKCWLPFIIMTVLLFFLVERNILGFSDPLYTWLAFCMCGYLLASESPWICNCQFTPGQRGSPLQHLLIWCVLFPVWLQHPQEISPGGTPAQEGTHLLPSPAASSSTTGKKRSPKPVASCTPSEVKESCRLSPLRRLLSAKPSLWQQSLVKFPPQWQQGL